MVASQDFIFLQRSVYTALGAQKAGLMSNLSANLLRLKLSLNLLQSPSNSSTAFSLMYVVSSTGLNDSSPANIQNATDNNALSAVMRLQVWPQLRSKYNQQVMKLCLLAGTFAFCFASSWNFYWKNVLNFLFSSLLLADLAL